MRKAELTTVASSTSCTPEQWASVCDNPNRGLVRIRHLASQYRFGGDKGQTVSRGGKFIHCFLEGTGHQVRKNEAQF